MAAKSCTSPRFLRVRHFGLILREHGFGSRLQILKYKFRFQFCKCLKPDSCVFVNGQLQVAACRGNPHQNNRMTDIYKPKPGLYRWLHPWHVLCDQVRQEILCHERTGVSRAVFMKSFTVINYRTFLSAMLLALSTFLVNVPAIFAHGGEDHGDAKPKSTANSTGTVSHASRVGDYEVLIKHTLLLPDTPTAGRLLMADCATNEPEGSTEPSVEIESANGAVTIAEVGKSESIGSYLVKIPALPEGTYTLRAKVTYKGATDTATFADVSVSHPTLENDAGGVSWLQTILLFLVGTVLLSLFGTLVYFVWRLADDGRVGEETAPA